MKAKPGENVEVFPPAETTVAATTATKRDITFAIAKKRTEEQHEDIVQEAGHDQDPGEEEALRETGNIPIEKEEEDQKVPVQDRIDTKTKTRKEITGKKKKFVKIQIFLSIRKKKIQRKRKRKIQRKI